MQLDITLTPRTSNDLLEEFGAGAKVYAYSSATKTGSYTLVDSVVLVDGTETYEIVDTAGVPGQTWYKSRVGDAAGSMFTDYSTAALSGSLPTYATLEQFKGFVRDDPDASADDSLMLLALSAAKAAVDRSCNRRFDLATGTATVRYFTPVRNPVHYGSWRYSIPVDDTFDDAPTIALDTTGNGSYTNALTSFRMAPLNAPAKGKPYTSAMVDYGTAAWSQGDYGASVTADWGWTAVPDTVTLATMMQAARFLKRRDAPFGVAGSPDMGNELRLLAKLDPDVAVLVANFRRGWGAV